MSKLYFSKKEAAILFLLGTKLDLESQRKVTKLEAEEYAKERGAIYFEISAKTEENIWEFQAELIRALLVKHQPSPAENILVKTEEKIKSSFWGLFG